MAAAVIDALRRFLPAHLREHRHAIGGAQRRAVRAISPHCAACSGRASADLTKERGLPAIDDAVWQKDWGVHLQPFGSGENIIKYLGRYVCRTAIGEPMKKLLLLLPAWSPSRAPPPLMKRSCA